MKVASIVVLLFCAVCVYSASFPCNTILNGKKYDFSALVAQNGSYSWTAPVNGTDMQWQVQICGDVDDVFNSCSSASPVNMITTDNSTCTNLGDSNVYSWDLTPFGDGVRLTYYHGAAMNNIVFYSTTLYLLCNANVFMTEFEVEHERVCFDSVDGLDLGGLFHIKAYTKFAC